MKREGICPVFPVLASPAVILAIGASLPLLLVDSSWGQSAVSPPNSALYFDWQTPDPKSDISLDIDQSAINQSAVAVPLPQSDVPRSHVPQSRIAEVPPVAESGFTRSASTTPLVSVPTDAALLADVDATFAETPAASEPVSGSKPALDGTAPAGMGETISAIQVRFLDKNGQIVEGHTRPSVFIREFNLRPGTSYDQTLAQQGLDRISRLSIVRAAGIALEPASEPNQVTLVVLVRERPSFQPSLGVISPSPSALEGPFQQNPALGAGNGESTGPAIDGNIQVVNIGGNDQTLRLQVRGGERVFDTELSFTDPWIGNDPTGISANIYNQRSVQSVFTQGDRDVNLPNGNTPWVHRLGGGVEVFRPLTPDLQVAVGVNYQRISIHNSAFETDTFSRDQLGKRLTVSSTGEDDLLTLGLSGDLDQRDNRDNPTRGSRFRFGIDQAIPVGDAKINFTRFRVNYTQFIPLNLFGFAPGPRTLVLNGQAGTMLGDVPPYEAFDLSSIPVGDYAKNSFGTGTSFALFLAEYRFPIANFSLFSQDVKLGGNLFGGYASTLGTDNLVIGQPSITREKPGEGFAYGFGLRALTSFGLIRLEFGLNDQGDGLVLFTIGDRF